ncbi:origin recognition complex subunit 2-domain-containing protein [Xylaria bambusicola]|uniref:origin recognition complex subunit 2-domain-containing protein n=1 Tax=Xylaria bambusicola TaxID=326684 RepID=UPI0020086AE6|nr:origin recognition complex subunit 2-domain-containing protein [Xylaria bambusicola]KAI0525377.1 origin recognition complex subunit 2-domain-containing protein [Xylaria bambusicola]
MESSSLARRQQPNAAETTTRSSSYKRAIEQVDRAEESTPSKRRGRRPATIAGANSSRSEYDFPSDDDKKPKATGEDTPRKRGRPSATKTPQANGEASTPRGRKSKGINVVTPSKTRGIVHGETPRRQRNDRSARKKSARALIEKVITGVSSDEEVDEDIAREIYESSEDDEVEDGVINRHHGDEDTNEIGDEPSTPSRKSRGRTTAKKGTRARKKSPTPPRDLPPHELYFAQNRPGAAKTSNNTLASLKLLTHEEYFSLLRDYEEPHQDDVEFLDSIHVQSFPQWAFELSHGFSVCLYGYGSKRALLHKYAKYIYSTISDHGKHRIVIVNGYVRANMSSLRDILSVVAGAIDSKHKLAAGGPSVMMENLKSLLSSHDITITVVLNSIDAAPLRRPGFQPILAQLAAHSQIQFICSADTPDFTLLWDSSLRSSFSFVFHDCTTFIPFTTELEVVDDVHELLGRKARRVGGKEGVTYVLRSLTENARNLYRLLIGEVLVAMDDEADLSSENPGIEYRMIYNKAVEEFICSSEMAFRTLLKEFHDHQMITSRKDILGTEMLSVPFRKEELEGILEDIV